MKKSLLAGCGNNTKKRITFPEIGEDWGTLVTLDIDPEVGASVTHDLNVLPYPFETNEFDEIHLYEVLEHCGRQGDWKFFFGQFEEFWRILKPGGVLCATVPMWDSFWAWGDPGHSRVIARQTLIFLDRSEYEQIGNTSMTDYRKWWNGNFRLIGQSEEEHQFGFALKAVK